MQTQIIEQPKILLIGLQVRTCNKDEFDPTVAKISPLVTRYFAETIADKIPHRKSPGKRYSAYSNYASDENGDYNFLVGEEVTTLDEIPDGLTGLVIPAGKYLKITSSPGTIPAIVISTWQEIWQMTRDKTLGGERIYHVDFEVYDERATDGDNAVFDVVLGVK